MNYEFYITSQLFPPQIVLKLTERRNLNRLLDSKGIKKRWFFELK